ncbi:hypothetical protein FQA39_LY04741 [Lamprigera yunnana]|nr:hypothetical protein FQA39_LY04741 [Lamprigera yunnana]
MAIMLGNNKYNEIGIEKEKEECIKAKPNNKLKNNHRLQGQILYLYLSSMSSTTASLRYRTLVGVLSKLGVSKGDRILIYMPLIAEAVMAMLATVRLGAVHLVVFGGFASTELANRIEHSWPKMIIAASSGVEPNKIIRMGPNDVWWAASDLEWVVVHSYICYGPLLYGITSVMYEGKPDRTPDPG